MKRIRAGFVASAVVVVGAKCVSNAFYSDPLFEGMVNSLCLSAILGSVTGVLSANNKETAENGLLLGVLVGAIRIMVK